VQDGFYGEITHKIFIPGHTCMPCDADFNVNVKIKRETVSVISPDGCCSLNQSKTEECSKRVKMEVISFRNSDTITKLVTNPRVHN
jgi:hypothetical protein